MGWDGRVGLYRSEPSHVCNTCHHRSSIAGLSTEHWKGIGFEALTRYVVMQHSLQPEQARVPMGSKEDCHDETTRRSARGHRTEAVGGWPRSGVVCGWPRSGVVCGWPRRGVVCGSPVQWRGVCGSGPVQWRGVCGSPVQWRGVLAGGGEVAVRTGEDALQEGDGAGREGDALDPSFVEARGAHEAHELGQT
jgi:hypothetical protein